MASNKFLQTISIFLCPFILCIISHIPQSFSQPNSSPQNIETFYPFAAPPLVAIPPPPPPNLLPPPPPALIPPPRKSSTRSAVGKAIGATAATTLVVSGLLFFLFLIYSRRRNKKDGNASTITDTASSAMPPQDDSFTRFSGNLKGVIVDENGLDVLYWRNLHDGENKGSSSFKKQSFKSIKDNDDHEDKNEQKGSKREYIHDVPLLRGKSSTSQSVVWGQKQDPITLQKPPSIPSRMHSIIEVNRDSSLQLVQQSPALPPRQPSLVVHPKGKMPAPELPPSLPSPPRTSLAMPRTKSEDRRFSGDLMEAMFGYVATRRKSPKRDRSGRSSQVSILDMDKSHQTTAVIKSLSVTHREIINAVDEGRGLNADTIEKLVSIAPNEEEVSRILAFTGDPTKLADPESFLHHLLTAVPSTFARLNVMRLRSKYELEVSRIKEDLESLESACKEIRAPGLFPKLLEAVLKAGNRLLSNAQAFDIAALKKLSGVKSSDGRTTLLQFVVQEVVRAEGKRRINNKDRDSGRNSGNLGSQGTDQSMSRDDREREYMRLGLPIIAGLSAEFPNVKKAAMLDYDVLSKTGSTLEAHVAEIQQMLAQCSPEGPFARAVKGFINTAELEMKILMEDQDKAIGLAKKTIDYYPSGTLRKRQDKENPLQVFVIMRDFLQMVDQVCADIAMDVERRSPATSSTSSPSLLPESPRVFRFPKLPPSFMADDDEDESDLQLR